MKPTAPHIELDMLLEKIFTALAMVFNQAYFNFRDPQFGMHYRHGPPFNDILISVLAGLGSVLHPGVLVKTQ